MKDHLPLIPPFASSYSPTPDGSFLRPPASSLSFPSRSVNAANNQIVPVHKRTKSERLLDQLVCFLADPQVNGRRVYLCKNLMDTKYVVWDFQIIFFGEDRLVKRIKSDTYFQMRENMTDTVIKSALQIISGNNDLWSYDGIAKHITPIRAISLYRGHFVYFLNPEYFVSSNFDKACITGAFVSSSSGMIQPPQNHNFLNEVDGYNRQDLIVSLNFLRENILDKLNISEGYFLIILTWLIQSITADNYTLLELIGESKSGKSYTQSVLRDLIDPNIELITQAPKKIKDLEKQTMNGHVMSFDDVENLNDEIQLFMVDLMSLNGAKVICPTDNKEYSGDIFVRRPIILNAVIPVVTHEKLQSKTLTIELKTPEKKWHGYQEVNKDLICYARLELLKIAKVIFHYNYNSDIFCTYKDMNHFSEIGLKLSYIAYSTTDLFKKQLSLLISEQSLAKLEENPTSYLMYLWAKENANTEKDLSVANWVKELEGYHDNSFGEWNITPKQFGSDLKKAAPVLRDFGIKCDSLGKRGSFVIWKIKTAEKIDLLDDFFELTDSAKNAIRNMAKSKAF